MGWKKCIDNRRQSVARLCMVVTLVFEVVCSEAERVRDLEGGERLTWLQCYQ